METNLDSLKKLGVKELTVKDGYATVVNPYQKQRYYKISRRLVNPCSAWIKVNNLPPIPTNLPDGPVKIEDVEEEERWQIKRKGYDYWELEDSIPVEELLELDSYETRSVRCLIPKALRLKQPGEVKLEEESLESLKKQSDEIKTRIQKLSLSKISLDNRIFWIENPNAHFND